MTEPREERRLVAADGVEISAVHQPGRRDDVGFVVVHGFTGGWREQRVQKVVDRLLMFGGVVAIDMRGHGRSAGVTTVGELEILDVAAAVEWCRRLGYGRVVTVGFSLGGAVVLREAGLSASGELDHGRVDAVVSVSAPAFWYYRGTRVMRVVHRMVETRPGRLVMRASGTRITSKEWVDPLPTPPHEAVTLLGATPLLVVHGDVDKYFPLEHPRALDRAAREAGVTCDMWLIPGFGHAESAISVEVVDRIGAWGRESTTGAAG